MFTSPSSCSFSSSLLHFLVRAKEQYHWHRPDRGTPPDHYSKEQLRVRETEAEDHFYTGFHPQSARNWINDPNGPLYFKGRYHLFFQYNPWDWNWGNMHWYHLVSGDLLHWTHVPVALEPRNDGDCGGVYSGSITILNGTPTIYYSVQCQSSVRFAVPADPSDVDLVRWEQPENNVVVRSPTALKKASRMQGRHAAFRDPTEAWQGEDGVWRMLATCDDFLAGAQQLRG